MIGKRRPPDTSTYRAAVRAIVEAVQRQFRLNDTQLADRIGCSAGTVRNAKREHANLDGVTLAGIEHRFGPGAVDPFLALGGSRATPLSDALPDIDPVLDIVEALHRLIEAQHASSEHGFLLTPRELLSILRELRDARRAFDTLILLAEPGLATASPEIRSWFHTTFDRSAGPVPADRAPDAGGMPDGGPPMPPGFADMAVTRGTEELERHYAVSAEVVARWLCEADEDLVEQMRRH